MLSQFFITVKFVTKDKTEDLNFDTSVWVNTCIIYCGVSKINLHKK
jgi:hypothetical protein